MTSSVVYHRLPLGPAPKQLTAYAPPQSLHEHFLAFAAKHNSRGFLTDEKVIESPLLLAFLIRIQGYSFMRLKAARTLARALAHELESLGVPYSECRNLIAVMAGYEDWDLLEVVARIDSDRCWIRRFSL